MIGRPPKNSQQRNETLITQQRRIYGYQCLGVPIGCSEFIYEWLQLKLDELHDEKESLKGYKGSKQNMYLMLRYCFCSKITYLVRSLSKEILTSPKFENDGSLKSFLDVYDDMKIEILEHIMDLPTNYLTKEQRQQALLQIREGGIGLTNTEQTATSGFAASCRSCLEFLSTINPNLNTQLRINWLTQAAQADNANYDELHRQWFAAVEESISEADEFVKRFFQSLVDVKQKNGKFNIIEFFIMEPNEKDFSKLQNRLNKPIRMLYFNQYLNTLAPQDRARLDSCIGNREDASAWLEAIPYCKDLEMSDTAFGIALKFRLGASFTEIDESLPVEQLKCIGAKCKRILEGSANHLCGGCAYGGHPTNTHNSVVQALKEILSSAGRIVKKGTKIEVDSTKYPLGNRDHVTPDLHIQHSGKTTLIDVTITNRLLPYIYNSCPDVATVNSKEHMKVQFYKKNGIETNHNQTLLPFAMESLGKIGKQGYEYINQVAADYGEHYKVATMKRYWFRKISVALQAGIGQAVSNIMKDWLNGKSRDEEQIQDDIDKYQMMDCRILGTASIKGLQEKSF